MVSPLCLPGAALHGATPSVQQPPPSSSVWVFGATPHMCHYAVRADSTSLKCWHTSRQQDVHEQTQYGHEVYLLWWEARKGSLIEKYLHIYMCLCVCKKSISCRWFEGEGHCQSRLESIWLEKNLCCWGWVINIYRLFSARFYVYSISAKTLFYLFILQYLL